MPRPPRLGPYAPLSASAYQDDALLAAGPDAELLFYRSLQFSAGAAADGYFTDRQVLLFGVGLRAIGKSSQALVREGVWVEAEGGYQVRSWLKWNRSAEQIGTERRRDRERKASGKVPESVPIPEGLPLDSLEWSGPVSGDRDHDTPVHSTPVADPPESAATLIAEWIDHEPQRPPDRVVGQVAKEVGKLLGEGFPYDQVRGSLAEWARRRMHPSALASVLHELAAPSVRRNGRQADLSGARQRALAAEGRA